MDSAFRRAMGATERMRLWFPNINVVMVARIASPSGRQLPVPDLRAAVQKARRKHPLLGARVELDDEGRGWFTTRGVPEIPIEVAPRGSGDGWLQWVERALERPWPVTTGPLARFTLLRSAEASDLIVNAHHSICDARSLAYLLSDILAFIGEPVDPSQIEPVIPVPLEGGVPPSASGGLLFRLATKLMNKKWLKKGISFTERDYQEMHSAFWKAHAGTVCSWSLAEPETSALVGRCRQRGVSVNSALYVAFLAAQHRVQGSDERFGNVLVPVDFRDYMTQHAGKALGLYASAVQIQFPCPADRPFWAVAADFDERVQEQLTEKNVFASQRTSALHPRLLDGLAFAMFGDLDDPMARRMVGRIQAKMRTGILVSNLGRLDLPVDYGDLRLDALIPPAIYAGNAEKALEVLTVGGRMYFTLTFDRSAVAAGTVRALRDRAMQILTGAEDR
jgi:NRPS condensation-like uncharacterized protein